MALGPDPKHKFERYIEFDLYILVYKQSHIRTFRNTNFGSQKLKKNGSSASSNPKKSQSVKYELISEDDEEDKENTGSVFE